MEEDIKERELRQHLSNVEHEHEQTTLQNPSRAGELKIKL